MSGVPVQETGRWAKRASQLERDKKEEKQH